MPSPRRKRLLALIAFASALGLLWVWPARRNYYFKRDGVVRRLDLPYTTASADPKRQLDLYLPRAARPDARPAPVVVFVHGGYWSPLDRRWLQPLTGAFGNVGVAFARRGIVAAVISYRQYPLVRRGDDSLDDVAAAIRFVRASCPSWGCDPGRVFVVGHSAGGHLASLLAMDGRILRRNGLDPEAIGGFVSIDGLFDLRAALAAFKPEQADIVRQLFGPDDASLAAHSTISYARAQHPPMLFVDSTGDERVCLDGFRRMRTRMAEVGSPARFVELAGLGHNEAILGLDGDGDPLMPALLDLIRPR
ncbi:MAG TPA: alpha/beta hydrolase [Polyangia bacterium]|nr:alpha/beta hydrolase [Polyangia bacterium]